MRNSTITMSNDADLNRKSVKCSDVYPKHNKSRDLVMSGPTVDCIDLRNTQGKIYGTYLGNIYMEYIRNIHQYL